MIDDARYPMRDASPLELLGPAVRHCHYDRSLHSITQSCDEFTRTNRDQLVRWTNRKLSSRPTKPHLLRIGGGFAYLPPRRFFGLALTLSDDVKEFECHVANVNYRTRQVNVGRGKQGSRAPSTPVYPDPGLGDPRSTIVIPSDRAL